ncbi:uncharacterized protein LOC118008986 [Mirounga leonina]|uniref:uncharacterized protein LOC118008986 n=1 Tax=Mirounga leonina TaxID=9715 RepID=UPI00156BE27F|nr:uncharacterized protein LOC118008986 [Mirounga leonina]
MSLKRVCPCLHRRGDFRSSTRHLPEVPLTCKVATGVCLLLVTIKAENPKKDCTHPPGAAPELSLMKRQENQVWKPPPVMKVSVKILLWRDSDCREEKRFWELITGPLNWRLSHEPRIQQDLAMSLESSSRRRKWQTVGKSQQERKGKATRGRMDQSSSESARENHQAIVELQEADSAQPSHRLLQETLAPFLMLAAPQRLPVQE